MCGERGARRLRLVILRRECSPSDGARGPAARHLVRRGPRTPRKAGDGGLTGNTTKPYSAPSPALRRPPPPRRWRGGGRARPPYPAVSRARLPDGRATPREGPRGPDAPRVEAPPKKNAPAAPRPRRAATLFIERRSYHHRPPFSYCTRRGAAALRTPRSRKERSSRINRSFHLTSCTKCLAVTTRRIYLLLYPQLYGRHWSLAPHQWREIESRWTSRRRARTAPIRRRA